MEIVENSNVAAHLTNLYRFQQIPGWHSHDAIDVEVECGSTMSTVEVAPTGRDSVNADEHNTSSPIPLLLRAFRRGGANKVAGSTTHRCHTECSLDVTGAHSTPCVRCWTTRPTCWNMWHRPVCSTSSAPFPWETYICPAQAPADRDICPGQPSGRMPVCAPICIPNVHGCNTLPPPPEERTSLCTVGAPEYWVPPSQRAIIGR